MIVNLGGDRLGSGAKMQQELHNYYRSTHNLSYNWLSSMNAGVLYPFMVLPAMRGDKFNIDLKAACRTIPTKGPLFGSYKMQLDVFFCPVRLYQALLHNNPIRLGMNMNKVYFPSLIIYSEGENQKNYKMHNSSLMKYLGLSGLGYAERGQGSERTINAIPALAYYDIFKQYYANKQEEFAYVLSPDQEIRILNFDKWTTGTKTVTTPRHEIAVVDNKLTITMFWNDLYDFLPTKEEIANHLQVYLTDGNLGYYDTLNNFINEIPNAYLKAVAYKLRESMVIRWGAGVSGQIQIDFDFTPLAYNKQFAIGVQQTEISRTDAEPVIKSFNLANIDRMREELLSFHRIGLPFRIGDNDNFEWNTHSGEDATGLPYSTLIGTTQEGVTLNNFIQNGLVLKTYQSDLYNNWLESELVDGQNGIAQLTAVSTANGKFTIDALNLSEKLYDMYNRILVSGGTYEDWQNVVYTQMPRMQIEMPIYCGGMSNEIVFEEIVQSAPAGEGDKATELGTLGGRGTLVKRKGGNVYIKCSEAGFVMGIVSITPRICYTQGNEFYLTDLETMDDFHKPALDGIGFQNLMAERLAYWGTHIDGHTIEGRQVVGKVPAWSEYMTNVDKAYGDFADDTEEGKNFMVLSRRYEMDEDGFLKDVTTYIDPTKHNYAFAYRELGSQNFWVQIKSNVIARRLMSAKQIPNI